MGDNSVIFHGISINYLESEFEELIDYPNSGNLSLSPKFYGAIIKGYIHPNNISSTATSKKVYMTNKGNIMINPNDTVLIEIN